MKAYVLSVAGAVLISAVLTIISPAGKMGKFVKGMTKLFILLILLSPLISAFRGGLSSAADVGTDKGYLYYCEEVMKREDAENISGLLFREFGITAEVATRRTAGELTPEKINVKITDFGIIGQDGHIDTMKRVQAYLADRYGCEVEVL